jgi:hypothetical protein
MSIMPTDKYGFGKLALLPFKVYIVAVPAVTVLSALTAELAGWNDLGASAYAANWILGLERAHRYAMLAYGYVVCVVGLLLGAICQREKRARHSNLAFAATGLLLTVLFFFLSMPPAKSKHAAGRTSGVELTAAGLSVFDALSCIVTPFLHAAAVAHPVRSAAWRPHGYFGSMFVTECYGAAPLWCFWAARVLLFGWSFVLYRRERPLAWLAG